MSIVDVVIKALACCYGFDGKEEGDCENCPYKREDSDYECFKDVARDAFTLLKVNQPAKVEFGVFCPRCGDPLLKKMRYCPKCGQRVTYEES